jgi:hypothetical protein
MSTDTQKKVFDACCGSKMFYFDKEDERVLFNDRHPRKAVLCDGRIFECVPDTEDDFKNLPYKDNHFDLVIFDPPHIQQAGKSYMAIKYGTCSRDDVIAGFKECWRITAGTLIFKWNDTGEKVNDLINAFGVQPLAGQRRAGSGKTNTIWLVFYKGAESIN